MVDDTRTSRRVGMVYLCSLASCIAIEQVYLIKWPKNAQHQSHSVCNWTQLKIGSNVGVHMFFIGKI